MKGQPGMPGRARSVRIPPLAHSSGRWELADAQRRRYAGGMGAKAGRHKQATGHARVVQRWSGAGGRVVKLVNSA